MNNLFKETRLKDECSDVSNDINCNIITCIKATIITTTTIIPLNVSHV